MRSWRSKLRNTQFALEDSAYFGSVTVATGDRGPRRRRADPITGDKIRRDRYSVSPATAPTPACGQGDLGPTGWSTSADIACRSSSRSSVLTELIARLHHPGG
jgi:hypothetical protein